jgi:hypothetical protein
MVDNIDRLAGTLRAHGGMLYEAAATAELLISLVYAVNKLFPHLELDFIEYSPEDKYSIAIAELAVVLEDIERYNQEIE